MNKNEEAKPRLCVTRDLPLIFHPAFILPPFLMLYKSLPSKFICRVDNPFPYKFSPKSTQNNPIITYLPTYLYRILPNRGKNMSTEPKTLGTRLAGKVAIVTGGGSGFGEAISKRFAEEACKVVVADLDPVGGERVASTHPGSMHFIKMNVASEEDWERCIENTLAKFGRLDVLVNNAGTSYRNKVSFEVKRSGVGEEEEDVEKFLIWVLMI